MKVPLIIGQFSITIQRIQEKQRFFIDNARALEKYEEYLICDTCSDSFVHLLNMPKSKAMEFLSEFCINHQASDFGLNAVEARINGYSLTVIVQITNEN